MSSNKNTTNISENEQKRKKRITGFEEWGGYMASKKQKLNAQFEQQKPFTVGGQEASITNIFNGISIFVNGYTRPSAEELKRLMMLHGGIYHYYYTSSTTFMVASNLSDSKIKALKNQKVITPNWITDCITKGKLLPYTDYLLYTPEVTDRQRQLVVKHVPSKQSGIVEEQCAVVQSTSDNLQRKMHWTTNKTNQNSKDPPHESVIVNSDVHFLSTYPIMHPDSSETSLSNMLSPSTNEIKKINNPAAVKAGHPDFISEFYSHSRLHHISTAGQELKQYVQQLAHSQKGKPFLGRARLRTAARNSGFNEGHIKGSKVIMHLDMDCFFVSVGLRNHPELRGLPVAVTHSKGKRGKPQEGSDIAYEAGQYFSKNGKDVLDNGEEFSEDEESPEEQSEKHKKLSKYSSDYGSLSEIASCSYEARKCGIWNGMFLGEARRLCPNLKTIPYDFEAYNEVSKKLYDIVSSYTLDIEAVSCDELYIDCTELLNDVKLSPCEFASILRKEIYDSAGCSASAGMGRNMLLARLATRVAKPNGQYMLLPEEEIDFMKKQKVEDLPGVGYSTTCKLRQLGIYTCGDLQIVNLLKLQQEFGNKHGQSLFDHCRGKDDKMVSLEKDRKSVSAEINYGIRFEEEKEIYSFLNELSVEVSQRLKKVCRKGRSVTLKLRVRRQNAPMQTAKFMGHGVCDSISKSTHLKSATDDSKVIGGECCSIAQALKIPPQDYRGIGIQIGKLELSGSEGKGNKMLELFLSKASTSTKHNVPSDSMQQMSVNQDTKLSPDRNGGSPRPGYSEPGASASNPYLELLPEQLDQSVLNALPEDIRQEVLGIYKANQKSPESHSNRFAMTSVPTKPNQQINKKSKKLGLSNSTPQKTLDSYRITNTKVVCSSIPSSHKSSQSSFPARDCEMATKAQLSGCTNIDEVRDLVKEWVESCEGPTEEDIDQFKNYLLQLIDESLDKTDIMLKFFYRIVVSAGILWREAYLLILSYVQQKMLQNFGYMMKASSDFE